MKKTATILMTLALAASAVMAQEKAAATAAKPATATAAPSGTDPVVMSAGDISIRQSEFEAAIKSLPAEYQGFVAGPGKKQFAEDFLRMKLLAAQGVKDNLDKDPEVVRQLSLMRENLVANAELNKIEKGIAISDADVRKAYDDKKSEFEQVKARHILVAFKGSPAAQKGKPELTEEQAKAKAEEIRAKLVAGADFATLAKAESDDTGSGPTGGDLGTFGHGQMVPEFEKAAFETKVGEFSPVIRTQYGYHILQVQEHNYTPYEQVKPTIEKGMKQEKLSAAIDAMKTTAKPTFNDAYFAAPKADTPDAAPAAAPATVAPASNKKPGA